MSTTPTPEPTVAVAPVRRQKDKAPRTRLRILIAGDPNRPMRSFSLPPALPLIAATSSAVLVVATLILAGASWRITDARAALERKVRSMVHVADRVAMGTAHAEEVSIDESPAARVPTGADAAFTIDVVNTGESMEVHLNRATGELDPESYRKLRHMLRCQHTTAETPIDPRLIDLLFRISERTHQKIQLLSGFRAPMYSKARLSYHTRGMAADIRIPGMTPLMARDLAESMGVKGLGYYPVSGFIHVDVRDTRTRWIDYGSDRRDADGAEHESSTPGSTEEPEAVEEATASDLEEPTASR